MDRTSPAEQEWYVEVWGGELFVKSWAPPVVADPTPLFLLHDSLGCVGLWRDFPRLLSESLGRVVVAYDRLGYGRSSERMEPLPPDFIVREAEDSFPAVRRSVGGKRFDLFGHSAGGGMAVACAAKVPGCRSVVTESAQALVEPRTIEGIAKAKEEFRDPMNFGRLTRYHGPKARWVLHAWTDTWLSPAFAGWSLAPLLEQVRCPVLAIHGDRDEYGSIASPEMIRKSAGGGAEMVIVPDCGHVPHREKPQTVIGILRDFYRDRVDDGGRGACRAMPDGL
jgi:pimeloyl-ACP methyl ester carboxylesterase